MQYNQHCITNLTIGTLLTSLLAPLDLTQHVVPWMFGGSFVFATFLLSPDLDLHHSSPAQNWGYLKTIWLPYSKIFKHRGLSHVPILGTGTRFIYLCVLACFGILIYDIASAQSFNWSVIQSSQLTHFEDFLAFIAGHETFCISILAGAAASDLSHLLVDGVGSFLKRL